MNLDQMIVDGQIDFLDFGCNKGGSILWAQGRLGGINGLGIDINPVPVMKARAKGLSAIVGDATALECKPGAVSFVTMLHFLEHLPAQVASQAIRSACRMAKDFVYMRHPWFGSDAELLMHGYKLYWSDWPEHPNHFGPLDFYKVIRTVPQAREWYIFGRTPITSVQDTALVPLNAAEDSKRAEIEECQRRRFAPLSGGVFNEVACLILTGVSKNPLQSILKDHVVLASGVAQEQQE